VGWTGASSHQACWASGLECCVLLCAAVSCLSAYCMLQCAACLLLCPALCCCVLQSSMSSCCSHHCLHSYPRLVSPQTLFQVHVHTSESQCMSSCVCLYHTPACLRRLERRLVYIVGTRKSKRRQLGEYIVGTEKSKKAKERLDV